MSFEFGTLGVKLRLAIGSITGFHGCLGGHGKLFNVQFTREIARRCGFRSIDTIDILVLDGPSVKKVENLVFDTLCTSGGGIIIKSSMTFPSAPNPIDQTTMSNLEAGVPPKRRRVRVPGLQPDPVADSQGEHLCPAAPPRTLEVRG